MDKITGKKLAVIGSTGSIGTQTLEVAQLLGIEISSLTANRNVNLMEQQARRFKPDLVAMADEKAARDLALRIADTNIKVASGQSGVVEAAQIEADIVISALVGMSGLVPTMAAIRQGNRRIALANKETLVCAGGLFTKAIEEHGCELIPVDSEHSAIFQCLAAGRREELSRIILTASGGPFREMPKEELASVTKERALQHPNWDMGAKVTIDSATMMNKGLEVIEAMHLFNVTPDMIHVLVHPQSIVHSAVEFVDNSVIAQMGVPDMRLPIELAITWPQRKASLTGRLDLAGAGALTFFEPDFEKFSCLKLALEVAERRDGASVVMNAANEIAVRLFLEDKIGFLDIYKTVSKAVDKFGGTVLSTIDDVLECDMETRHKVFEWEGY